MSKFKTFPEPEPEQDSPSRETGNRFQTDRWLRDWGYQIYSRPEHGEPRWSYGPWREGDPTYTQSESLLRIEKGAGDAR